MSEKNFMSYGDAETLFTEVAEKIREAGGGFDITVDTQNPEKITFTLGGRLRHITSIGDKIIFTE